MLCTRTHMHTVHVHVTVPCSCVAVCTKCTHRPSVCISPHTSMPSVHCHSRGALGSMAGSAGFGWDSLSLCGRGQSRMLPRPPQQPSRESTRRRECVVRHAPCVSQSQSPNRVHRNVLVVLCDTENISYKK